MMLFVPWPQVSKNRTYAPNKEALTYESFRRLEEPDGFQRRRHISRFTEDSTAVADEVSCVIQLDFILGWQHLFLIKRLQRIRFGQTWVAFCKSSALTNSITGSSKHVPKCHFSFRHASFQTAT